MRVRIFYAWQSLRTRVNKDFIQAATQMAIDRIAADDTFEIDPSLDRDTLDVPGAPIVAQSILEKIDKSSLFLGDVTIISQGEQRPTPNPNVMIELGYAAARLGWERIICVMNVRNGGPGQLPFDLQHRRWPIQYQLTENANEEQVTAERQRLSENIEYAIRSAIQSGVLVSTINPKDRRVALKLESALGVLSGSLLVFIQEANPEFELEIFGQDHENMPGTNYPDPALVDYIVNVFAHNNLRGQSNHRIDLRQLTWAESFFLGFRDLEHQCDKILDQYADRDEALISLVDDIQNRAHGLAAIIESSHYPALEHLYDNGVPDVHIEFFRYYLLTVLKAFRIIRQFKDE